MLIGNTRLELLELSIGRQIVCFYILYFAAISVGFLRLKGQKRQVLQKLIDNTGQLKQSIEGKKKMNKQMICQHFSKVDAKMQNTVSKNRNIPDLLIYFLITICGMKLMWHF